MWLVYLLALVLGGGVLLMQLVVGHHHIDAGHGLDSTHPVDGPGLFSTRSLVFALFDFGLVGGLLHILELATPEVALAIALVTALATGVLTGWAFRTLDSPAASGAADFTDAKGLRGRIVVECARGRRGKVRVELKGLSVDMLAETNDLRLPVGTQVVIVDVLDDTAQVRTA